MGDLEKWILLSQVCHECVEKKEKQEVMERYLYVFLRHCYNYV